MYLFNYSSLFTTAGIQDLSSRFHYIHITKKQWVQNLAEINIVFNLSWVWHITKIYVTCQKNNLGWWGNNLFQLERRRESDFNGMLGLKEKETVAHI